MYVQWVYRTEPSDRTRDRGGRLVTDVIDIDAENDEGQFEVDGSGNGTDDEGDTQSGDGDEESSGGTANYVLVVVYTCYST